MDRSEFIKRVQYKSENEECWQGDAMELLNAIRVLADANCIDAIGEPAGKLWDCLTDNIDDNQATT